MKIELEEPFKSKWRYGYIVINPENRRNVILYNGTDNSTTTSYARYRMGVILGYEVPSHLEVDHIDDDKTNDADYNLQTITGEANREKERLRYLREEQIKYSFTCPSCFKFFTITDRIVKNRKKYNENHNFFCSQKCGLVFTVKKPLSQEKINSIKELNGKGLSNYRIGKMLNISPMTVAKYK